MKKVCHGGVMKVEKMTCRLSGPPQSSIEAEERFHRAGEILDRAVDLPVFSTMALELVQELSQPESSVEKIREIVSSDPVIAARVLRHANSSFYSIPMKIQTIRHAVSMLGLSTIKEIALAFSFHNTVIGDKNIGKELEEYFLKRNLTLALLSKKIAIHLGFPNIGQGEAFLAGLLKDIGIYALLRVDRSCLGQSLKLHQEQGPFLFVSEERHFGCNHSDVGALLAQQWKLPDRIQKLIQAQFRPDEDYLDTELLAVIQLADAVMDIMEANEKSVSPKVLLDSTVKKILKPKFEGKTCEEILHDLTQRFGGICLSPGFTTSIMDDSPAEEKTEDRDIQEKQAEEPKLKPPEPQPAATGVELDQDLFSDWSITPKTWFLAFICVILILVLLQNFIA